MLDLALTDFCAERLFDPTKAGTTVEYCNRDIFRDDLEAYWDSSFIREEEGYAPFCKLVFMKNWDRTIKAGAIPITPENQHLLRSEYSARTPCELPVLTRWIETDDVPRAEYLVLVLYSKDQIDKEYKELHNEDGDFSADWGIVAVLGQMHDQEEPMPPVTMMRNALGTAEGGSGHPLDREAYRRSVEFWGSHAVVKKTTDAESGEG